MAYGLPDPAPDTVTEHRLPERARRREADTRAGKWVRFFDLLARALFGKAERREERTGEPSTCVVDLSKIG